jgi:ubiquinone/menaquinone biosynthesis C-methylase UbiE
MNRHVANLLTHVPDLLSRKVLDLGCGRGKTLVAFAREGVDIVGLEKYPSYITMARSTLAEAALSVQIVEGEGEALPFSDGEFGFVNMAEVIEHVEDPAIVLGEVFRVLAPGGAVYVSAPNRFGVRDPHFHLLFANWLPRTWADGYCRLWGKGKDEDEGRAGRQLLSRMHYFTEESFRALAEPIGFSVEDIRALRIARMSGPKRFLAGITYAFLRSWYFDTYHMLLRRPLGGVAS